jgi:hypothetical protein
LNPDPYGLLYYGQTSKDLFDRINSLIKSILRNKNHDQKAPNQGGHNAISLKFFRIRIRKSINVNDLRVRFYPLEESSKIDEAKLLEDYVSNYGELPPLNGIYGSVKENDWSRHE